MTGAYSVHTIYEGHEIMFHVSTMLPYSNDNKQQVISLCLTNTRSTISLIVRFDWTFFVSCAFPIKLERKRHIGNDIVNIVFLDGSAEDMANFSPNCIKSQFTRKLTFSTIREHKGTPSYQPCKESITISNLTISLEIMII